MRRLLALGLALFAPVAAVRPLVAQTTALSVNPASREEMRQFYRGIYNASERVPMQWTGSYAGAGNPGDISSAFKEATRLRINFYRALVGLPADIAFNPVFSAKAQQAALMMSGNNELRHVGIPTTWTYYTAAGAEAAAASNLALGNAGPAAVDGYIADAGAGLENSAVGHRRWLFYPQTLRMGTGDVPGIAGNNAVRAANAIWVFDDAPGGRPGDPRPVTRTRQVPYPPAGYVPHTLVWPRWSFTHPDADFSAATVTMTRGGQPVPVRLEPLSGTTNGSIGETTLVWVYDNRNTADETPHARPTADTTYTVAVNNVRIAGAAQNFTYNVTVFDPDVAGPDAATYAISGPATPAVGTASTYTVAKNAFAAGIDWRTVSLGDAGKVYTAEAGLDGLTATTTSGYAVVQSAVVAAGSASYRLTHMPQRGDEVLQLPGAYYVSGANAVLTFQSRLAIATAIETARVQVSADDGVSWIDLFTQTGTSATGGGNPAPTEAAFVPRTVSLAGYAGRTVRIRFLYSIQPSGSAFTGDIVGWYLDSIALGNVLAVTGSTTPVRVANGASFAFTPAAAGAVALQARGVLFGQYPLEWGPIAQVNALSGTVANPGRLINMSIRTGAGTGDATLIVGVGLGGAGTQGNKAVLLRGVGPTLGAFGVGGVLADPVMTVFQDQTTVATNDDWSGGFDFGSVGAFNYAGTPVRDAAIYDAGLRSGSYSIQIAGKNNGTGVALAEIYDATPTALFTTTTPRLVNVSARTQVGTGDNILIAGFVVGGSSSVRVLIRAVGPTLGVFGVGGFLADPKLELFNSAGAKVGENDNWLAADAAIHTSVGAFDLAANSRDAALVTTLAPGSYTAQISGVGGTTGVALVEVYEVPVR